jgi:integrase
MLKIHAIIKKYNSKSTANVMFRVRDGKKVDLSYTSEIVVDVNLWDKYNQGYLRKDTLEDPKKELVNQQISDRIKVIREVYSNKDNFVEPTSKWLTQEVNQYRLNIKNREDINNVDFIKEFDYYIKNHDISDLRRKSFITVYNSFVRFQDYFSLIKGKKIVFRYSDIDFSVLTEFQKFLHIEYQLCKTYPSLYNLQNGESISKRGNNTIIGYMKKLTSFIYYYKSKHKQTYNPFENYKIGSEVYGNPIVLTKNEFKNLQNVGIVDKKLQVIRDIFILNCMVGFRVTDYFNLKHTDVINDKIEYYPSKTRKYQIKVSVPLNDLAKEIISKYKSDSDYLIPRMSLKVYRTGLKKLFKTVGLSRMVTYLDGKTNETEHAPLDQLVSAHIARRVFLSTLVNMGFNSEAIYSMSGHRVNSKEISRYYSIEDSTQIECVNGLDLRITKPQKPVSSISKVNPNSSLFVGDKDRSVDLFGSLKRM